MTAAKNDIFIFFTGLNWLFWCERNRWGGLWWEGRGRKMSKFLAGGGYSTYPSSMENPIYIYYIYIYVYIHIYIYIYYTYTYIKRTWPTGCYIQWGCSVYITYIMCPIGHLTSARFEHFVCHKILSRQEHVFSFPMM